MDWAIINKKKRKREKVLNNPEETKVRSVSTVYTVSIVHAYALM